MILWCFYFVNKGNKITGPSNPESEIRARTVFSYKGAQDVSSSMYYAGSSTGNMHEQEDHQFP